MNKGLKVVIGAAAAAAAGAAYHFLFRPWHVSWGTTRDERDRKMPLDELIENPNYLTNRAVTINAPAEKIWPWLVQMGELPRGGFYTYSWIERLLGMRTENATAILQDFQQLKPGDPLDRDGNLVVKALVPNRFLVRGPPAGVPSGDATWTIELVAAGDNVTRLISRVRARIAPNMRGAFWVALLDPGQFIMERKWLHGVKARAEGEIAEEPRKMLDELVEPVKEKVEPARAPEIEVRHDEPVEV
ncbi:MAG TPA: SRPBCC family protein [Thermoanaerobaculia bacterium]|nr:SRPBCC family protein [Thermoanaerobaculia bacterium]